MKFRFLKYFLLTMASLILLLIGTGVAIAWVGKYRRTGPITDGSHVRKLNIPDQPHYSNDWQRVLAHPQDWGPLSVDSLMQWDYNPWKPKPVWAGEHLMKLRYSKDPSDQAKLEDINKRAAEWFQRVLARHPDMAVEYQDVPDDENGLLRMLDFVKQFGDAVLGSDSNCLRFPKDLIDYSKSKGPWNEQAARDWLANEPALFNEIRIIGLLPTESAKGISVDQWALLNMELYRASTVALMIDARIAAEDGDIARAMESIRAANGLADHLQNVETPIYFDSILVAKIRSEVQLRTITEVIPALPEGSVDLEAWEDAVNPVQDSPADLARLLKGEWTVGLQREILPVLADLEDPKSPPDAEDYIDVVTEAYRRAIHATENLSLEDMGSTPPPAPPSMEDLSLESRQFLGNINEFPNTIRTTWMRNLSISARYQAAFAIMQGEEVPNDPIYGLPYVWDTNTRELSYPDAEPFRNLPKRRLIVPDL